MEAIFWSFLTHWLAHKFIDSSVDLLATKIDESAPSLLDQPGDSGWTGGAWSEDQRRVIEILQKTRTLQGGRWRAWLQREAKRPILLIGASGTGKSVLALRLLGTEPSGSIVMSPREERLTLIQASRRSQLIVAPGEPKHALIGIQHVVDIITGTNPPQVVCIVVAGGYLATSSPTFMSDDGAANFRRPSSNEKPVARSVDGFTAKGRAEEIDNLINLVDMCKDNARKAKRRRSVQEQIPSFITVINKRDLWSIPDDRSDEIIKSYTNPQSRYGRTMSLLQEEWGLNNPCSHDIIPLFTFGGGFHPAPDTIAKALPPKQAVIDALLLRALIFYRYTRGSGHIHAG